MINTAATAVIGVLWLWHLSLPVMEGKAYYFELPMWYRWATHQPLLYVAAIPAVFGVAYSVLLQGPAWTRASFLAFVPFGIFLATVLGHWAQMSEAEIRDGALFLGAVLFGLQLLSIWAGGAVGMLGRHMVLKPASSAAS